MSRSLALIPVVIIVLASANSAVFAFNGERGGFILGFGAGPSMTSYSYNHDYYDSDRRNEFGLGTDFKIGGGFNNQFLLYYVNRVAWFKPGDATIAHTVGLLGASYYLKTEAPAWYFVAAVGVSAWDKPFETYSSQSDSGLGLTGGAGYEFSRHWSIEATLNWGNLDYVDAISVMVTVFGLAY
jgi:hypothetical protein